MASSGSGGREVPRFDRTFDQTGSAFSRIGDGELGGKAHGLVGIANVLAEEFDAEPVLGIEVSVPRLVVLTTEVFDGFLRRNHLLDLALSDVEDERIAAAFLQADLPPQFVGDLRALVERVQAPLAVRSSSLLEDALYRPFAGVYATKMTPNNQPDPDARFAKLVEAVKLVWASTYFRGAKCYAAGAGQSSRDEKMAVVVQEVVGTRYGERYYPAVSGVARSHNYYPFSGASADEGVVSLALGLGKTIVDGGMSWSYSPARPRTPPPFVSVAARMRSTQVEFWAVNMGRPPAFDPLAEAEYLAKLGLEAAEYDGSLVHVASTYVAASDRLVPGIGADGPRVVDFAPLLVLRQHRLNDAVRRMLTACERVYGGAVEIEFALTLGEDRERGPARLGFLQVRPMVVSSESVDIGDGELDQPDVLVRSGRVMGNGIVDGIQDVVYVRPERFEARSTRVIAGELEKVNATLLARCRPYLLLGFGRWGSTDPWLGIPVAWGQICGARVIVEASLPAMTVDPSQGSHFFHNITSFRVAYFTTGHEASAGIDWAWLDGQPAETETGFLRHLRLDRPLLVKVDGRSGRGAVWRPA